MTEQVNDLKNKGNKALAEGDYQGAADFYSKGLELDPNNHVLYSNRSGAYASLNQYDKALEDANKCVEIKADWSKGWSRKGTALFFKKDYEQALESYKKGLELEPGSELLKAKVQETEEAIAREGNPLGKVFGPDIWAKLAANPRLSQYLKQPDFVQKISMIQQNPESINMALQDPRIMATLGELLGLNIQTPESFAKEEGMDIDKEETKTAQTSTSTSVPKQKQEETPVKKTEEPPVTKTEAKPEVKKPKVEEMDVSTEAEQAAIKEKELGNEFYKQKKFEEALTHYNKAIELDNSNISFYMNRAACYFESGNYAESVEDCQKAVEVGRRKFADFKIIARAYLRMGNAYAKMDNLEEAIKALKESLTEHRNPDTLKRLQEIEKIKKKKDEEAYINPELSLEAKAKGNEAFKNHLFPDAVKHYSEAIKRNPKDHVLYSNRAAAYTKLAEYSLAKKDCETCLSLDPNFVKGYLRLGQCYFSMKEYHKALETYDKGLRLDGENQELIEASQRVISTVNMESTGQVDEERVKRAMADPEIQNIMRDPMMQSVLQDLSTNPKAANQHMRNPEIKRKIEKLIAAGVVRMG